MWTLKLLVFVLLLFAVDVTGSDDDKYIDGDLTANKTPTLSTNPSNQWWMIDLGELIEVTNIELYSKTGSTNIAGGKTAQQSSTYKNDEDNYGPQLAVDGSTDSDGGYEKIFTHTSETVDLKTEPNWWMVDLKTKHAIETIKLYNRKSEQERLAKISILTSAADVPNPPFPASDDWTKVNYQEEAYGDVGIINFSPPVKARHVAVCSEFQGPLALVEVEIYGNAVENIYILTTQDQSSGDPSLTSNNWTVRYCHEPSYGDIGNIILEEGVPVKHVAVYTSHSEGMTLDKVKIFAYKNLAYNKTASQSSTYESRNTKTSVITKYYASRAIDGILYGNHPFALTNEQDNWWRVDLGEPRSVKVIELYSRTDLSFGGFYELKLLSSTDASVGTPTTSNGWSELTTYTRVGSYAPVSVITLSTPTTVTHLAVLPGNKDDELGLKEVQIFQFPRHNHALDKTAAQSETYDKNNAKKEDHAASWTVDGQLTNGKFSHTAGDKANEWWKVDLGKSIIFQYARIYVRSGDCGSGTLCEDRLSNITFLTNHKVSTEPPVNGVDGWTKCLYHKQSMGKQYIMVCEENKTPYTREFAISVANNKGVALDEVQVYGYNQPLKRDNTAVVERYKEIHITFDRWKDITSTKPWIYNTIPAISADNMHYTASIDGKVQVIISPPTGGWTTNMISVRLTTNQIANRTGRVDISCKMGDDICPGPSACIHVDKAKECTMPEPPTDLDITFTGPSREDSGRRVWTCMAKWMEPQKINCDYLRDEEPYKYKVNDGTETFVDNNSAACGDVAATAEVKFSVRAINNDNKNSTFLTQQQVAPQAAPSQPMNPSLVAVDDKCLTLSWDKPKYSNGNITRYEYNCTGKGWTSANKTSTQQVCGYKPYTDATCTVRAVNDGITEGDGDVSDPVASTTLCTAPELPTDLKWTRASNADNETGLRKWNYTLTWEAPTTINCKEIDKYKITTSEGQTLEVKDSTVVLSINAGSSLTVSITSTNNVGNESATSLSDTIVADDAAPSKPLNVSVRAESSECVSLTWNPPTFSNGIILSYQYKCTGRSQWNTTADNTTREVQICIYKPNDNVKCQLRANNSAVNPGDPATDSTITLCKAPTFDVSTVEEAYNTTNDTVRRRIIISVKDLKDNCNGSYTLIYSMVRKNNAMFKKEKSFDQNNAVNRYTFDDLDAVTNYTFEVKVLNNDGSTKLIKLSEMTGELPPADAPSFDIDFDKKCVTISNIKAPSKPNGEIVSYQVVCGETSSQMEVTGEATRDKRICGLKSAAKVTCSVTANNSNYRSTARQKSGFTLPSIVAPPTLQIVPTTETDTVTITIMPVVFENSKQSEYLVLVWSNSPRGKRATTTATCKGTNLSSYTTPQANKPCYVAGAISSSNFPRDGYPFKVGDGSTKGAYTNKRLAVGEEYTIRQAATYKIGSEELIHVLDSSIKFKPEKEKEGGPPIGAIVGSVVAVVVCTGIGIGIYIRWRRGKAPKKGEGEDPPLALSDLNSDSETKKPAVQTLPEPVVVAPLKPPKGALTPKPSTNKSAKKKTGPSASSSQAEASNMYGNLGTESQWVIPIDELEDFILGQKPVIDKQYELLEAQPAPTMDVALLPENKGKSRYKGLYPADGHRVTLKPDSSLSKRSTDYINASFIPGYKKGQMYIAAQGPTEATVDDFWLMIWQQKIAAIIMVTGAIEHGKVKCKQYWSDNHGEVMTFRDITVTHTFTEVWADYTIRTLQVTKDSDTRTIKHFNYITWPDHGVPNDMGPYITYFAKIKAATYRLSSTKLVHCSAGVGRTGTYIAMDKLLEQVEDKRVVDPFTCVTEMRLRRPCMIQTIEQYQFLYQAIVEFLHTSNYACSAPELDAKLRRRGQGRDMVAEEFAHIEKRVKLANFDYTLGKDPDNRDRNRFSEILPAKHCSLYLTGGKVSYINAIQVDAHREKNQWIVTQLPLSNTVTDFWELMVENQMTVLAQLEVSQVPFYPRKDGEQMEVGPFIISRTSAEQTDSITNVSLQLETANAVQDIQVILCRGWVSDVPSTDSIMELQNALEKVQQQTGNKKVCITCNNGSTRCGILICSYNAIEKLKAEQEADVYNPVLMAKHRRPQFIPSLDQYEFIYQVIRDYTEAFSEYANFK